MKLGPRIEHGMGLEARGEDWSLSETWRYAGGDKKDSRFVIILRIEMWHVGMRLNCGVNGVARAAGKNENLLVLYRT
jgi:hypothetical protein